MSVTLASLNSTSASVASSSTGWWLKDPVDGSVISLFVEPPFPKSFAERDAEYPLLGRADPVVITDTVISLETGTIVVLTANDTIGGLPGGCTYAQLLGLIQRTHTLLLTSPSQQWYVRFRADRQVNMESSTPFAPVRRTTLKWTEVAKP